MNQSSNTEAGQSSPTPAEAQLPSPSWHQRHRGKLIALALVLACVPHAVYSFRFSVPNSLVEDVPSTAIARLLWIRVNQGGLPGIQPRPTPPSWVPKQNGCSFFLMEAAYRNCKEFGVGVSKRVLTQDELSHISAIVAPVITAPCRHLDIAHPQEAIALAKSLGCDGPSITYDVSLFYVIERGVGVTFFNTKGQIP